MTKTKERSIGRIILALGSSVISRGAGIIFTPVFTRILTPSEYSVWPLYSGLMGIFTVICTLEISGNAIYKGLAHFKEEGAALLSSAVGAVMLTTGAALVFSLLRGGWLSKISGLSAPLTSILIIQIFFNAVIGIYLARLRYASLHGRVTLINAAVGLTAPPLALLFIALGKRSSARIYAHLLVSGIIAAVLLILMLKESRRLFSGRMWRFLFSILLPMLPHYLASTLLVQGDKLIVSHRLGEAVLGRYSLAYSVGHLPSILTGAALISLTPCLMKCFETGDDSRAEKTTFGAVRLCAVFTVGFISILPELFFIFASREYYGAFSVAYLTAFTVFISFAQGLFQAWVLYWGGAVKTAVNTVCAAALALPLIYLFTDRFGALGSSYAVLISYAILLVLNFMAAVIFSRRRIILSAKELTLLPFTALFGLLSYLLRFSFFARIPLFFAISLIFIKEGRGLLNETS